MSAANHNARFLFHHLITMRPSRVLLNAAKGAPKAKLPVEMYPLFAAVGVACASGVYFTYRHFTYDRELRLWNNANLSNLDEVLNKEVEKEKNNE